MNAIHQKSLKLLTIFLFFSMPLAAQFPTPPQLFANPLSPRIANYDIVVKLDTEKNLLHGKEILTWKNTTSENVSELQFHLYLNAFRNSESTFMIEKGRRFRGFTHDENGWGYSNVNRIVLLPNAKPERNIRRIHRLANAPSNTLPGIDLSAAMTFIHPDNPTHIHDKTVMRVPLPHPLAPGQSVSLFIDFTAKLPEPPYARTGAKDEFYFVAQWFPKTGVFTNAGWNCHQFHTNSEFFADFGVYNVWMTVPAGNLLGATGVQVGKPHPNNDGTVTHFYHAEDVHDFAWSTSPDFEEFTGKSQDVDIRVLMQKDHIAQGIRHVEAVKTAVASFQDLFGDYPYPNVTAIDPRRGASEVGGMEYPTLFTTGTTYGLPENIHWVELEIIHEFGHNYWQGMVATNEFEEAWLDEGINTYSDMLIMNRQYGPRGDGIDFLEFDVNNFQMRRLEYLFNPTSDPMLRNAWEFASGSSYSINAYSKPGILLTSLHNYLGEETMQRVMRTYFERWKFKHPRSQDFVNVVNEVSGQNFNDFFNQAFYTPAVLDYAVTRLYNRLHVREAGIDFEFPVESSQVLLAHPDTVAQPDSTIAAPLFESGFTVRRKGDFKFPVEIEAIFENGEAIREQWDGKDLWKKFNYIKPAKIVSATVDPDSKMVMDINYTNNSKTLAPQSIGINKLSAQWLFWTQFLMDQPEILNLLTIFSP